LWSFLAFPNDEQDLVAEEQRVADADGMICRDDLRSTILERQLVGISIVSCVSARR
jgi:hypothetical protein